jgi:Predicted Zn-dependent hydrolases of the beta-lactamase fold
MYSLEEPMTLVRDAALIAQIDRLTVPHGQVALWSLGQAGFVVKGGNTIAYIDPYLSNSVEALGGPPRRFPIPLDPALVTHAQVVLTTHEHLDHTDAATLAPLMSASPLATLVTSLQGRQIARDAGIPDDRIITPRLGERIELAGLAFTAMPAAHYAYEVDVDGHSRWMGFIIECNGVTVYHSGDTIIFPELLAALVGRVIDIALLPINGRDFFREREGIIGNLWPGEAVELAKAIDARVLIGIHNDLFAGNRVSPGMLFDELDRRAPFMRCHLLQPGELYLYAG